MKETDAQSHPVIVCQRGPAEHERREQIIKAADLHFRQYGYDKTTVSELAKAIGVTGAYVYRFFASKQAIGQAICLMTLERFEADLREVANGRGSASEKLRRLYKCLIVTGYELFFHERKLHDIVVAAIEARWPLIADYKAVQLEVIRQIVTEGRAAGEFERKTPLDEVCLAISQTIIPFSHPALLAKGEKNQWEENARAVVSLVLRSLAP